MEVYSFLNSLIVAYNFKCVYNESNEMVIRLSNYPVELNGVIMLVQLNGKGIFELHSVNSNQFINVNGRAVLVKYDDKDQAYVIIDCSALKVTYF